MTQTMVGGPTQELTRQAASGHHLLGLTSDITADDVIHLAQFRWPHAAFSAVGDLVLSRYSNLTGPFVLSAAVAQQLGFLAAPDVGTHLTQVYLVSTLAERGDPPWPGSLDPTGIARAFPDGLPIREAERVVEWLVAVARRLGGAVRFDPSGVVVWPLPEAAIDLTVYSNHWLDLKELTALLQAIHPAFDVAGPQAHWSGPPTWVGSSGSHAAPPPDGLTLAGVDTPGVHLSASRRAAIHAAADKLDVAALSQPVVTDAYAARADFGSAGQVWVEAGPVEDAPTTLGGAATGVETGRVAQIPTVPAGSASAVEANWAESVSPVLADSALAGPASTQPRPVAYALHWVPLNPENLLIEFPDQEHRRIRQAAGTLIKQLATVLQQTIGGEIRDQDGFRVP